MQLFSLPTAVLLLSSVLSTNGSPILKCLVACNRDQAAINTTDSLNGLYLHRSGPVHLVTREARFKVHTPGTPWPVAAPKTSTISKIRKGIKKIFSKDVEAKSEDAATLEARSPRFKVHTPGTPWPVAAPKTSTISKITNGIKKIFSKSVAAEESPVTDESAIEEAPVEESEEEVVE